MEDSIEDHHGHDAGDGDDNDPVSLLLLEHLVWKKNFVHPALRNACLVPLIMMLVMIIMNDNHEYHDDLYEYQAGTNMVMILRAGV